MGRKVEVRTEGIDRWRGMKVEEEEEEEEEEKETRGKR